MEVENGGGGAGAGGVAETSGISSGRNGNLREVTHSPRVIGGSSSRAMHTFRMLRVPAILFTALLVVMILLGLTSRGTFGRTSRLVHAACIIFFVMLLMLLTVTLKSCAEISAESLEETSSSPAPTEMTTVATRAAPATNNRGIYNRTHQRRKTKTPQQRQLFLCVDLSPPSSYTFPAKPGNLESTDSQLRSSCLTFLSASSLAGSRRSQRRIIQAFLSSATQATVDRLPIYIFRKDQAPPGDEESGGITQWNIECTICLEDVEPGDKIRILPCMHQFHAECVGKTEVHPKLELALLEASLGEPAKLLQEHYTSPFPLQKSMCASNCI